MKSMLTASKKAKARTLQKLVKDALLAAFPVLHADDVRSVPMGVGGEDLQLSPRAREYVPYQFECKNQERFKGLYEIYDQAAGHGSNEPVVVLKINRRTPLVVISLDLFVRLISR